jgi:serine/threonine-protein kinase HipA
MFANLQICLDGEWVSLATFEQKSETSNSWFEYEHAYVIELKDSPLHRAGLRYPVNFETYISSDWPAFLVDILPSGAGRRVWLRRLGLTDNESIGLNWELLLNGAGNPPGNIRIVEAAITPPEAPHPGFTMDEIIQKNADFIEYAEEMGAVVAGATDIPGDAPKFMMVRSQAGNWHPDGSLLANEIKDSWIVKFPRGKHDRDFLILRNEAKYLEVARWFGVRVGAQLHFQDNALFIPRFDREAIKGKLLRHGLETLNSVAGVVTSGRRGNHQTLCAAIREVATDPKAELLEYLKRDILNVAMRNVDNHGRNTAFLKRAGAKIELSPLYDFAAMYLDPDGIARATLWPSESTRSIGRPDWREVAQVLADYIDPAETVRFLTDHAEAVRALPGKMKDHDIETEIINGVAPRCEEIAADLERLRST